MKKQPFYFLLIFATLSAVFSGCMKKQSFSEIPAISLTGLELTYDTSHVVRTGILTISYQDGNGDIGLAAGDTFPPYDSAGPYYYNFVIQHFEKINGVYHPAVDLIPFSARIPVLTPDDPNRAISGFIVDTLILYPPPLHDTIRFEAFIYDRALNKSNLVTTPEIILRRK
jgi:hypothetical protein